jgi:hypothetical protein
MTSYFYGNGHFEGTFMRNVLYTNGNIQATNIDMDMRKITTLATPTMDFDAANKVYVDQRLSSALQEWLINLSGSGAIEVAEMRPSSFMIFVGPYENDPISQGGPTGAYVISKSHHGIAGQANTLSASPAATGERIVVDWPPNSGLRVRKTGDNFDGTYIVQRK